MPLLKGNSPEVISENIAQLIREGRDQKQAIAIAYKQAGRSVQKTDPTVDAEEKDPLEAEHDADNDDTGKALA